MNTLKKHTSVGTFAVLVAFLALGCAQAPASFSPAPTSVVVMVEESPIAAAPDSGGDEEEIIVRFEGTPPATLDPTQLYDQGIRFVASQVYDPIFGVDADGDLVPVLAESLIITPTTDTINVLIDLREDVSFSDGSTFTANDLEVYFRPRPGVGCVQEEAPSIEIPDDYTLRFSIPYPQNAGMTPEEYAMNYMKSRLSEPVFKSDNAGNPVGTGDYVVDSWEPDNYVLVRREDSWRKGTANPGFSYDKLILDTISGTPAASAESLCTSCGGLLPSPACPTETPLSN